MNIHITCEYKDKGNDFKMSFVLTTNQLKALKELEEAVANETVVCLTGPYDSGKRLIIEQFLIDKTCLVLDIRNLVPNDTNDIYNLRRNLDKLIILIEDQPLVYLKDFERALKITSNYRFRLSVDVSNMWIDFLNEIRTKTILTCGISNGRSLISDNIWMVELKIDENDRREIINRFVEHSSDERDKVVSYSKGNTLKEIDVGIKRANKLYLKENIEWSQAFLNVLMMMETCCINPDKVIKPEKETDMVGLEDVIKVIENDVIKPIELNDKLIPICRGILLYGPPGTGKTTVCRWLTHRLKGKVFMVEPSEDESFNACLKRVIDRASANAPAVVIIDEIEMVSKINKRSILTCLDGLDCLERQRITVVATTMEINNICESYIRGKRFERCIKFTYPSIDEIRLIIRTRLTIASTGLKDKFPIISSRISKYLNEQDILTMARSVNGQSQATIHYVIDVMIRQASISDDNLIKIFIDTTKEICLHIEQTNQIEAGPKISNENLYT